MTPTSYESFVVALAQDRQSGASALARNCLQFLAAYSLTADADSTEQLRSHLSEVVELLIATRPSMAPIANLLRHWEKKIEQCAERDLARTRHYLRDSALDLLRQVEAASSQIAEQVYAHVGKNSSIITLSVSSILTAALTRLADKNVKVIVSESRPLNEGYQLAKALTGAGIHVIYITDAQLGIFAAQADLALVGADSILDNNDVVNKSGTLLLALACRYHRTPMYVCAELFKKRALPSSAVALEKMSPVELGVADLPHMTIHNQYFEVVPHTLFNGWFNEKGLSVVGEPTK